ncbi:MAG: hypothetical protein JSR33_11775 [Proteobacteria bacterium]|nr:hypothetical protein [Pseudomonadota bacterium]
MDASQTRDLVVGCINLGEKNIAGFISQFLLVGFPDMNGYDYLQLQSDIDFYQR